MPDDKWKPEVVGVVMIEIKGIEAENSAHYSWFGDVTHTH